MLVIAKTKDGALIQATTKEIQEILSAVIGDAPSRIEVGQKIPAIDYAGTIKKLKSLNDTYDFKKMFDSLKEFNETAEDLKTSVNNAANISL